MYKVCIILKNGVEINTVTDRLMIRKGWNGKIKRLEIQGTDHFIKYINNKEIAAVLAYPMPETEAQGNG